jgi:hypothetical protein
MEWFMVNREGEPLTLRVFYLQKKNNNFSADQREVYLENI